MRVLLEPVKSYIYGLEGGGKMPMVTVMCLSWPISGELAGKLAGEQAGRRAQFRPSHTLEC